MKVDDLTKGQFVLVIVSTLAYLILASWGLYAAIEFKRINNELKRMGTPKGGEEREALFSRTDTQSWSCWQSCVGAVTIFPLRVVFAVFLFIMGLLCSLVIVIWENYNHLDEQALSRLARNRRPIIWYNWMLKHISFMTLFVMGIRIHEVSFDQEGNLHEHRPPRHLLNTVISNHVAALDILYLLGTVQPGFVAKAGVKTMPIVGAIATVLGTVFVDRGASKSREATLAAIVERQNLLTIQSGLNKTHHTQNTNLRPLAIFPEGTTTSGVGVLPFKRGAFYNENAVVNPVILTYTPPKYNAHVWIPSYDIVDMLIYIPLFLSNLGNVRLSAYWYNSDGIVRRQAETGDDFMTRCEHFMRTNLEYLRVCGKLLGVEEERHDVTRWRNAISTRFFTNKAFVDSKLELKDKIHGNIGPTTHLGGPHESKDCRITKPKVH